MNTEQPIIQSPLNKTRADKWIFLFNMPQPLMRLNKTTLNISKESVNKNSVQFALSKLKFLILPLKQFHNDMLLEMFMFPLILKNHFLY